MKAAKDALCEAIGVAGQETEMAPSIPKLHQDSFGRTGGSWQD